MIKLIKNDVRVDLDKLHPNLKFKIKKLLKECLDNDIGIIITEGYRTKEYQDMLYAKGRTLPGKIVTNAKGESYSSQHQWGIAFDIAINDPKNTYNEKIIAKVAGMAKKLGLSWGGDWKTFKDTPHIYMGKWGSNVTELKIKYGTPDKFMETWKKKVDRDGLKLYKTTARKTILHRIPVNSSVKVLYTKLWYAKIEYNDTVGFVRKKYLR